MPARPDDEYHQRSANNADNPIDIQEFHDHARFAAENIRDAVRHGLRSVPITLTKRAFPARSVTGIGDEGGFATQH